jgi:microtubule-associated protein-like 6
MAMLEDQIRDALRGRRTVYEDSKSVLLKMFKWVTGRGREGGYLQYRCMKCRRRRRRGEQPKGL